MKPLRRLALKPPRFFADVKPRPCARTKQQQKQQQQQLTSGHDVPLHEPVRVIPSLLEIRIERLVVGLTAGRVAVLMRAVRQRGLIVVAVVGVVGLVVGGCLVDVAWVVRRYRTMVGRHGLQRGGHDWLGEGAALKRRATARGRHTLVRVGAQRLELGIGWEGEGVDRGPVGADVVDL